MGHGKEDCRRAAKNEFAFRLSIVSQVEGLVSLGWRLQDAVEQVCSTEHGSQRWPRLRPKEDGLSLVEELAGAGPGWSRTG